VRFNYEVYRRAGYAGFGKYREHVTTRFAEVENEYSDTDSWLTEVYDNMKRNGDPPVFVLGTRDDFESWRDKLERDFNWRPKMKDDVTALPDKNHMVVDDDGFHRNPKKLEEAKVDEYERLIRSPKATEVYKKENPFGEFGEASKDPINPAYYQGYFVMEGVEMQWIEAMQYVQQFRDPVVFKAILLFQVMKYQARFGGKEKGVEGLMKSVWYQRFLAAYNKNGDKPIRVADIDRILKGE
jgi:Protein of unknwon function (DUF3310)